MADDSAEFMLSTIDNPWNPWNNYDEWYQFDRSQHYDTTGFLARVANISNDLSDLDRDEAIREAIDEIVKQNVSGNYIKVTKSQTTMNQGSTK
jgi:uncharacterized protein (DUF2267 family)